MKQLLVALGFHVARWTRRSSASALGLAAAVVVLLPTVSSLAQAQPVVPIPAEYGELLKSRTTPAQLGPDLFGDEVNLYDGSLRFRQTDISLPGNDALPVALTRSFQVQQPEGIEGLFADWELEIPHLHGVFSTSGWIVSGAAPNNRCSAFGKPPGASGVGGGSFSAEEFWSGTFLSLPGGDGGELLKATASTPLPTDGHTYPLTTRDGIVFRCLPSLANGTGSGEGFEAVTPEGMRYQFNHMVQRLAPSLFKAEPFPEAMAAQVQQSRLAITAELAQRGPQSVVPTPQVLPDGYMLNRKEVWILPTVITDRFGNTVTFTWDATDKWKLVSVAGSDGRTLTFTYAPGTHRITGVSDGSHSWAYGYTATATGFRLSSVTLPDTSSWSFNLEPLRNVMASVSGAGCDAAGIADVNPSGTGTLTHPGGATGSFTVAATEHGRSHVTLDCRDYNYADGILGYAWHPAKYLVPSLTSKTLSGAGLTSQVWSYSYGAANGCYEPSPGGQYPEIGGRCTVSSPTTTTVAVTDPDNAVTRHTFGNHFRSSEGQLLKIEAGLSGGTALRTTTNTYAAEAAGPWPNPVGTPTQDRNDGYMAGRHRPVRTRTIVQQNTTFSWSVPSSCASNGASGSSGTTLCFDRFARPTKATETGSHTRTVLTEYHDHTAKWVLGQVKKATLNSTVVADIGFDPTYALPLTFSRFGQPQYTLAYDTVSAVNTGQRGTLYSLTDGNSHTATYTSWKRGVPQAIAWPDGSSESAAVSNTGWIESVTDELGYKTCYEPDALDRLKTITYPSESVGGTCNTTTWSATSIAYDKVASPPYNLPANLWRRTETTGTRKFETYYDGAWQPILERRFTTDASAGERFVRRDFFPIGRNVFESFPIASVPGSNYTQMVIGTHQDYDELGRPLSTTIDSELGLLIHSTSYLTSAFQTVDTNARSKSTTTTYQTFSEPSYDAPLAMIAPEGITTTYTRDAWSKPLTLTRSGSYTPPGGALENLSVQRRFVYDLQQRLCKTIEPDAGITVFDYDAAGNLAWRAAGQATLTTTNDCQRALATDKSFHHYDARNRLTWIDHPAGTSDVGYGYDADGAMLTAAVSATDNAAPPPFAASLNTWTYTYKRRRLLATESLAVGARTFGLTWNYHARGDVSSLTYPSGHSVSFNPNAYGEPRQVGTYATNAVYHPSGGITSFTYGNLTTRTITRNTRQWPWTIVDTRSGTKWLDHTLTYDENGNLKTLTDGVVGDPEGQPSETRTLTYDGRDRLTGVTLPVGSETYGYDPLDNLRRSVIGGVDRRFQVSATTQRLGPITAVGTTTTVDHGWNDRGELASRTTTTPSIPPTIVPPTIYRNGFEDPMLVATETFVFDRARRMVSYQSVPYQYDAHNRRVLTTTPAWGTRYQVYSRAGELLYVEDAGYNQRTEFFHLSGTLVAERNRPLDSETVTVNYLHSDHRGTPTVKTSSGGSRIHRSRLMPYGTPYDGIYRDGPGFTKHATDEIGPMSYMQQRYFDFAGMRFLSPDPDAAGAGNFNRYAYANNNPYSFVDPDGRLARGTGFEDKQWDRFDKAQQRAAKSLEKGASKITQALETGKKIKRVTRAFERSFGEGSGTAENMAKVASDMSSMAKALRDTGANAIPANGMTTAEIDSAYGGSNAAVLAAVPRSGPTQVIVNTTHSDFGNLSRMLWAAGHETAHAVLGYRDVLFNGAKGYKFGSPEQRDSFENFPSQQRLTNPDHLMDYVR